MIRTKHLQFQTDFTQETGDCVRACVATILSMNMDEVPNFNGPHHTPMPKAIEWLEARGYKCLRIPVGRGNKIAYKQYSGGLRGIAAVPSTRYDDTYHAVVFEIGDNGTIEVVHDPNPEAVDVPGPIVQLMFIVQ